ncbi:MAG: hypothetical protein E6209_08920, partial [Finegoldia magna]|nr:hypothetical protein [Finegoldia magna]
KPEVTANKDGSVTVTPPADKDTKSVDVTYTPEGEDTPKTVTVTKGEDGDWTTEDKDVTVDPTTGKVTIPADKVKDGSEVKATAKDEAGNKSPEAKAKTPDTCLPKYALQEQFEKESGKMFDGIGTKEGIYEGVFDKENKEVTVKIFDKNQKAQELSGTGLIDGLIELYKNNHLAKVQIGDGKVLDLKELEEKAPESGMTFAQILKLAIGSGMLTEVQDANNQTGNLSDFINKTVHLHLTLHQEGCEEAGDVVLTYTINGVDGNDKEAPAAPKVTANEDGSVTVTPPTDEDTKSVDVTYTPEGEDTPKTVTVTKGGDGNWTAPEGSDITVDPTTGKVTIPADKVKDGSDVTATAKDKAGNVSDPASAEAGNNPTTPTIDAGNITAVEGQPIPPVMVDVDDVNATVTV